MNYTSIIHPKTAGISVSRSFNLGVANYDLRETYSPDTAMWKSKVLDLVSPKYSPNRGYIFDHSRYNNHGAIIGATWKCLPSGLWVLNYDGTDDYVTVTHNASVSFGLTDSFSILVWFRSTGVVTPTYGTIATKRSGTENYSLYLNQTSNNLIFDMYDGAANPNVVIIANHGDNVWRLCAAVRSVADDKLYLSLNAGAQSNAIDTTTVTSANVGNLLWGWNGGGGGRYFPGQIALPRIFKRALSAAEIKAIFDTERDLLGV